LAYSRLAYDLESLLSPLLAGLALLAMSYTGLFLANSTAFIVSAGLIVVTSLPKGTVVERLGGLWNQVSFGVRAYLKTARLRGLLALYLAVASASSMVIVNTVVHVRENLGLTEAHVAMALAASGAGSMAAALSLPRLLDKVADRSVMIVGALVMALGLGLLATGASFSTLIASWLVVGVGWSLVQTPAGRVVTRSASASDRPAYFSAQFALSHLCWLVFYPVAGYLGTALGIELAALTLSACILAFTWLAAIAWPRKDPVVLEHEHDHVSHTHWHVHDEHHRHEHQGTVGPEPHSHHHEHPSNRHAHAYVIDDHHPTWPRGL
jgi:hypothetical protein